MRVHSGGADRALLGAQKTWQPTLPRRRVVANLSVTTSMTTDLPEGEPEVLWDDGEFILSRVRDQADRGPILLVRLAAADPTEATSARLEHAHAIRAGLEVGGACRASLRIIPSSPRRRRSPPTADAAQPRN